MTGVAKKSRRFTHWTTLLPSGTSTTYVETSSAMPTFITTWSVNSSGSTQSPGPARPPTKGKRTARTHAAGTNERSDLYTDVRGSRARGNVELSINPLPRLIEEPPSVSADMLRPKKKKLAIRIGRKSCCDAPDRSTV